LAKGPPLGVIVGGLTSALEAAKWGLMALLLAALQLERYLIIDLRRWQSSDSRVKIENRVSIDR
jgi:hypothetical protein